MKLADWKSIPARLRDRVTFAARVESPAVLAEISARLAALPIRTEVGK